MFVNPNIGKEFINQAGDTNWSKANSYQAQGKVKMERMEYEDENNFEIQSLVSEENKDYPVYIQIEEGEISSLSCECEEYHKGNGFCIHVIASYLEFTQNKKYEKQLVKEEKKSFRNITEHNKKYSNFLEILETFYEEKPIKEKQEEIPEIRNQVHIEPKFLYSDYNKQLKVNFKIGIKQLYRLKSLSNFYTAMKKQEGYKYGAKLEFIHKEEAFLEEDRPLLQYLLEQSEIITSINRYNKSYYAQTLNDDEITLTPTGLDYLFDLLVDKAIDFEHTYVTTKVKLVDHDPEIYFEIENQNKTECKIKPNIEVYNSYTLLEGDKYTYFLMDNKLYRCSARFKNGTLKLLEVFRKNIAEEIVFAKEYLTSFYNIVMPKMEQDIKVEGKQLEDLKQYIPEKLGVKMFLDMDQRGYITAELRFCYGNMEINPLLEEEVEDKIARNSIQERDVIWDITNSGFRLDQKNHILVMPEDDDIYEFLNAKIEDYMRKFEVLATENLKEKQIKQPKIGTIGVKLANNLLNIDLSHIQMSKQELQEIMEKYTMKKKYHRLKNGSFLELEENQDLAFLDNLLTGMDLDYKALEKDTIQLPIYRSMYLEKLLEKVENIEVDKEQNYATMVREIESKGREENIQIPISVESVLRHYQKTGYKWLKTIDSYQFGGILADDMGLRKNSAGVSNFTWL